MRETGRNWGIDSRPRPNRSSKIKVGRRISSSLRYTFRYSCGTKFYHTRIQAAIGWERLKDKTEFPELPGPPRENCVVRGQRGKADAALGTESRKDRHHRLPKKERTPPRMVKSFASGFLTWKRNPEGPITTASNFAKRERRNYSVFESWHSESKFQRLDLSRDRLGTSKAGFKYTDAFFWRIYPSNFFNLS